MRVIAGTARSLPLKAPEGLDTRPTTDRIKETLFNMLMPYLGGVFVDLFSGSGAIGIEAISRGCERAYFVENDKNAIKCILDNIAFTRFSEQAVVLKQDVFSALWQIHEKEVGVIYMDPPYNKGLETEVLLKLKDASYVSEDTLIVIECSLETELEDLDKLGYELVKEKRYKTNKHYFVKKRN